MTAVPGSRRRFLLAVRAAGLGCIVLGLAADLLGVGGRPGFGERQAFLVLVGSVLFAGTWIGFRREPAGGPRLRGAYSTFAVLLLNTALGFALLNLLIAAGFALTDGAGRTRPPAAGIGSSLWRLPMLRLVHAFAGRNRDRPALALDDAGLARIYPGWPRGRVAELLEESWERPLRFDPATEFSEVPFQGKYVNVREPGYRLGRDPGPWPPAAGVHNVWVFGGSTAFGYGVADGETIPSFLQESLRRRYPGTPVAVYNFGQAYFYSSQELSLLQSLLATGAPAPEVAVFLDGINEHQSEPYYSDYLRGLVRSPETAFLHRFEGTSLSRGEQVAERWARNERMGEGICASFRIKPLFVWQPAPDWRYDLRHHLLWQENGKRPAGPAPVFGNSPHYAAMAAMVKLRAAATERLGKRFLWLGDLQEKEQRPLYVDRLHYTAAFNREIAERIADRIQQGL